MKGFSGLIALVTTVIWFTSTSAFDRTGTAAISAYLGHGLGFEGIFEDQKFDYYQEGYGKARLIIKNKLSYSFGAKVKSGINPNLSLVIAWEHQEVNAEATISTSGLSVCERENYYWNILLANIESSLRTERATVPNISGGFGMYMPKEGESKPGINGGIGIEHFFKDNVALDLGARFHLIFTEGHNTGYLQFFAGLTNYFGVK